LIAIDLWRVEHFLNRDGEPRISSQYNRVYETEGRRPANIMLVDLRDAFGGQPLQPSGSDDDIIDTARGEELNATNDIGDMFTL